MLRVVLLGMKLQLCAAELECLSSFQKPHKPLNIKCSGFTFSFICGRWSQIFQGESIFYSKISSGRFLFIKKLVPEGYPIWGDSFLPWQVFNFALRSGQEHRDLQLSQIELVEHTNQLPYLVCTENISKNNRGGLEQRKIDAKQVVHHSNTTNPDRCFKKYMLSTDLCLQCFAWAQQ